MDRPVHQTERVPKKARTWSDDEEDSELTELCQLQNLRNGFGTPAERSYHLHGKVITDPIHSSIELPACLLTVIDTPQFQRLKGLKQLGATHFVYPAATHTRFEHSVGVAHLGMKFVKTLKEKQPELGITEMDELCVGLAGLCHDLGHGPFSHLFDGEFLRGRDWAHENGSVLMLRYLLKDNGIDLQGMYNFKKEDVVFVEELILGKKLPGGVSSRLGRDASKAFLYDIINNERSGFDVDKVDYILRDSYFTGVASSAGINVERIIQMARVFPDENNILTISFPEKEVHNLFGVFQGRVWLHSLVYQHKVVKACEYMIRDILFAADEVLRFKSKLSGQLLRMSESVEDMSVFAQLKDSVLDLIELSVDPRMKPAQELLARLRRRDLYRCCGVVDHPKQIPNHTKAQTEAFIARELTRISQEECCSLSELDFIVEVMAVHHGKGVNNPVDGLRFYSKSATRPICETPRAKLAVGYSYLDSPPNSQSSFSSYVSTTGPARCFQIAQEKYRGAIMPQRMGSNGVRVFAKSCAKRNSLAKCFRKWSRQHLAASPLCHNSQSPTDGGDNDETCASSPPPAHFESLANPHRRNRNVVSVGQNSVRQSSQLQMMLEMDD